MGVISGKDMTIEVAVAKDFSKKRN